jgi:hypothetical protein
MPYCRYRFAPHPEIGTCNLFQLRYAASMVEMFVRDKQPADIFWIKTKLADICGDTFGCFISRTVDQIMAVWRCNQQRRYPACADHIDIAKDMRRRCGVAPAVAFAAGSLDRREGFDRFGDGGLRRAAR